MDFAPYQDVSPETHRALSPTIEERRSFSPAALPTVPVTNSQVRGSAALESGRPALNEFDTSLPIRLDYEACLAYLLLPPAGGVLLLVMERKSDYVRFHAWQSSLLFSALFIVHVLFSWSRFLSWLLFMADIALVVYLTLRAYRDADTLDRCEVPFFGAWASRILDDE